MVYSPLEDLRSSQDPVLETLRVSPAPARGPSHFAPSDVRVPFLRERRTFQPVAFRNVVLTNRRILPLVLRPLKHYIQKNKRHHALRDRDDGSEFVFCHAGTPTAKGQ